MAGHVSVEIIGGGNTGHEQEAEDEGDVRLHDVDFLSERHSEIGEIARSGSGDLPSPLIIGIWDEFFNGWSDLENPVH